MNYVICGPAGCGKSTYVRNNMQPGDLVVDLDAIYAAISYLGNHRKPETLTDMALTLIQIMIDSINPDQERNRFPNAWIIIAGAKKSEREYLQNKLHAKIIMFDISQQECLRRIENDNERSGYGIPWGRIVKEWWDRYESDDVKI